MKKKFKIPGEPRAPRSIGARRVGAIFHRRAETKWSVKEIEKYMLIHPVQEADLVLVEKYYAANYPPWRGHNILRTDLITLLNNWQGEVDRAKIWMDQHRPRVERKIIPLPRMDEGRMSEEEREIAGAAFKKLMGREMRI